jgi:hypothetical protein
MRRTPVLLLVAAVALIGLVAAARLGPETRAQEGTPPAGGFEISPGVTAEALAFAAGQEEPSLYRLTFAPGVTYAIAPSPEISLVYSEAGSLTITVDAPVTVTRAGATDAPGEPVAANAEFTLGAGDYTVFPPFAGGEVRNDGQEAASVEVAAIIPSEMGTPSAATPAP